MLHTRAGGGDTKTHGPQTRQTDLVLNEWLHSPSLHDLTHCIFLCGLLNSFDNGGRTERPCNRTKTPLETCWCYNLDSLKAMLSLSSRDLQENLHEVNFLPIFPPVLFSLVRSLCTSLVSPRVLLASNGTVILIWINNTMQAWHAFNSST